MEYYINFIFNFFCLTTPLTIMGFALYIWRTNRAGFNNFTIWLALTVIVALMPILAGAVSDFINGIDPTLSSILGRGDLFLISVAISSDGIGRLLSLKNGKNGRGFAKNLCIILCVLIIGFSSLLYSSSSRPPHTDQKRERVYLISTTVLLSAIVVSGSSVVLSEVSSQ